MQGKGNECSASQPSCSCNIGVSRLLSAGVGGIPVVSRAAREARVKSLGGVFLENAKAATLQFFSFYLIFI